MQTVGVIGGLGAKATIYFYDMVVNMTDAKTDQEHIDMIISNRASTPDRTEYILGKSNKSPKEILIRDVKMLEKCNVDFIVITCNTAHYFYDEIQKSVEIPIVNMIEETIKVAKRNNFKKLGILATSGTITTELYQNMCKKYDIKYQILNENMQQDIMDIIYKDIKSGKNADMNKFNNIINHLKENKCDGVILGCTELSVLRVDNHLYDKFYIDSLETLAIETIKRCNKKLKEK